MGPGGHRFAQAEKIRDQLREPKPQSIREVPGYICRVVSKFLYRLFYIFKIVWETKPWILFYMVFMAVWNGAVPVITSIIGKELLNELGEAYIAAVNGSVADFNRIAVLLIISFGFSFIVAIVGRISGILNNIASELVVNSVNMKIMLKSRDVDLASFDDPDFYEKFENAKREAGNRPIHILNSNFTIISSLITMVSFVVILGDISPLAPLAIVIISIPTAIINFAYRKKNFFYVRFHSKERRQMNYYSGLMTNKDMVKEIRLFGLSDTFIGRYHETFLKYFGGLKKLFVGEGVWNIGMSLVTTAVNCALFLYIAKGVAGGLYEVGDYSLYTGALSSIASGIATVITTTASIYEGTLFIDNLISFMNEKRTITPSLPAPRKVSRHTGHRIVFENVSFSYPGTERKVINNVNLTLEPGDTCVLVGLNGAGKTTLIKLLTRLYDPTEGRILFDGHDIREYDVDELYSIFGIIFQDFGKYAVNVRENIKFGEVDADKPESAIVTAAEQSSADGFINDLPDGYDTPLMRYFEDNGIELSIGQWQKLSIARAFYSDSDIIILDEPTASLDAIAEQEIYNQFDSLRRDKTTIFVSHRLSSATVANKIVVLENGSIVEIGDHSELMKLHGRYYELFTTQAKRYITPIDGQSAEEFMMGEAGDVPTVPEFVPHDRIPRGPRPPHQPGKPFGDGWEPKNRPPMKFPKHPSENESK